MGPARVTVGPGAQMTRGRALVVHFTAAALLATAACDPPASDFHIAYAEIVDEEDARGALGLERVREHLGNDDPRIRAAAVRALGRLEEPPLHGEISPLLGDPDPTVRTATATALAQSVFGTGPGGVTRLLASRIREETDPATLGALATNLGRLTLETPDHRAAASAALTNASARLLSLHGDPDLLARLGLARGIEAFARGGQAGDTLPMALAAAAASLATLTLPSGDPNAHTADRIRRTAAAALVHTDQLGEDASLRLLRDADWGVRRQVVLGTNRYGTASGDVVPAALDDPDPRVRVEAVRAHHRWYRSTRGCDAIIAAAADPDPDVAAVAIGLLGRPCSDMDAQVAALRGRVAELGEAGGAGDEGESAEEGAESDPADTAPDWRAPARALHALAALVPGEVAGDVGRFARHANPFVRAWAARAAGQAGIADVLAELAEDPDPNVREAALQGLAAAAGVGVGEIFLAQLGQDDPQLVMTAVRQLARLTLEEPPTPALLAALARFTARERETERDVRVAILGAICDVGGFTGEDIEPYLTDFDPVVADRAVTMLNAPGGAGSGGTGGQRPGSDEYRAAPEPLPRTPPPTAARLAELERSAVVLTMAGLGDIVIALRPDLAATNADRFARLAGEGYFDGLTFQRVEPNFVIQGGGPNANEYSGDGPYSRDEISDHPHWRGTVGLSTRGRDTGDAQIFVNLADNLRLDFNYTIHGVVVEGMDVVDAVQEGAVIERATVVRR